MNIDNLNAIMGTISRLSFDDINGTMITARSLFANDISVDQDSILNRVTITGSLTTEGFISNANSMVNARLAVDDLTVGGTMSVDQDSTMNRVVITGSLTTNGFISNTNSFVNARLTVSDLTVTGTMNIDDIVLNQLTA